MLRRLPLSKGDEYDVVNPHWRRHYGCLQRAGVCKAVKNRINRRERRYGKAVAGGDW